MPDSRFSGRIESCREALSVFEYLEGHVPTPVDYSDILRAQVTKSISAFDTLIHDIIHDLMLESFLGRRPHTSKFRSFSLPFSVVREMSENTHSSHEVFSRFTRGWLKKETYQDPERVAEGLALVWEEAHKWRSIAEAMGEEIDFVRTKLRLASRRRNAIVHESDYDPALGVVNAIAIEDVEDIIEFVEQCGLAIWQVTR